MEEPVFEPTIHGDDTALRIPALESHCLGLQTVFTTSKLGDLGKLLSLFVSRFSRI